MVTVARAAAGGPTQASKNDKLIAQAAFMPGIVRLPGHRRQMGGTMLSLPFILPSAKARG